MSIEVRHITKSFGSFTALNDVSLTIPDGRLVAQSSLTFADLAAYLGLAVEEDHPDRTLASVFDGPVEDSQTVRTWGLELTAREVHEGQPKQVEIARLSTTTRPPPDVVPSKRSVSGHAPKPNPADADSDEVDPAASG